MAGEITLAEVHRLAALRIQGDEVKCSCHFERNLRSVPSSISYNLLEACHEPGCPLCRLEQRGVERYLDNQFYENVNSPAWRDQLRLSHGFCHEHAWLGVSQRLGDALGYSIIYHDLMNHLLRSLEEQNRSTGSGLKQAGESARKRIEAAIASLTPKKRCPACEHRAVLSRDLLAVLLQDLHTPELSAALQASDGLCLPHLREALESTRDSSAQETLIAIHRNKLGNLKNELAEFIRKNDYQNIKEGFGREGNAWLRAISLVVGNRKER